MKRTAQILALSVRVLVTLAGTFGRTDGLPVADNARVERFVPHGAVLEGSGAISPRWRAGWSSPAPAWH